MRKGIIIIQPDIKVIDIHTHIFPDRIAARTLRILSENTERISGRKAYPQTDGTLDGIKKSMKKNNISVSLVLPIATNVHQSSSINAFAAQINGIDGVYSFGSVHPMQEDWEKTLYEIKELGLLGIKLHPEYQCFDINSVQGIRLLKKCEEIGLYVAVHAGRDVGVEPPVHCSPKQLHDTLGYISGKGILAAHMGGWKMWDEVEKYLVGTDIMFDTSYSINEISDEQFLRIVKNHGSEKILFGTDSPWKSPAESVYKISSMALTDKEKENIFFNNARKLLNI